MKKIILGAIGMLVAISHSFAVVTIIPPTNGIAISADTAADSATPSWTSLDPIVINEGTTDYDKNDFGTGQEQTFVLKAPTGFEFNTAAPPSVFADGGLNPGGKTDLREMSVAMLDATTIQITFSVTGGSAFDSFIIGDTAPLQVRPLSGTNLTAGGYIYRPTTGGGTAVILGVSTTDNTRGIGGSSFGQLGVVGGAPQQLVIATQPSEFAVMGWEFGRQPVIAVHDQFGNPSSTDNSTTVTATRNAGVGSLIGTTTLTAVNGIVTYTNLGATDESVITIDFSATGLATVTSDPINVQPPQPPVPILVITQEPSSNAVAGEVFAQQPVIRVEDQYGRLWNADYEVTVTRLAGSGDLQGTVTANAVNGVAVFTNLSHNVAGTITIAFSGSNTVDVVSAPITISPNVINALVFTTQPGGAVYGNPLSAQPALKLVDAYGNDSTVNLATNLEVSIAINSGTGSLVGTTTLDIGTLAGNGTVAFSDLSVDAAGVKTLIASADGLGAVISDEFTIAKADQTIDFGALSGKTYGDAPFTVSATASSGLPVTFTVAGPASVSGDVITILGAGLVTVTASQAGDDNYNAATPVDQSFTVSAAGQTITFGPIADQDISVGSFTVSASASSGLPVTFSIVSGNATVSGGTITLTGVGLVTVRASQAGNTDYMSAADVEQTFRVTSAQTITFAPIADRNIADGPLTLSASASSGLAVTFSIVSGPATISGATVTFTNVGLVTVRASQAGDINYYAAADVEQTFRVVSGQTITFDAIADRHLVDGPLTLTASASSGLPVTFSVVSGPATLSGDTLTFTNVGLVTVRASQAGDDNYLAADDVEQTFRVNGDQTITFEPLADTDITNSPITLVATASSGLPVTFTVVDGPATVSSNELTLTNVGLVTVRASQGGNENYLAAADVDQTFRVTSGQTITFEALEDRDLLNSPFIVSATASSGLPVTFSIVTGPAIVEGNVVTLLDVGLVTIRASQEGDENYNAALDVDQSFRVTSGQTISFATLTNKTIGDAPITLSATASSGLPVTFSVVSGPATLDGDVLTLNAVGRVTVRASQGGDTNYHAAPNVDQTFLIRTGVLLASDFDEDGNVDILVMNTNRSLTLLIMERTNLYSVVNLRSGIPVALGWDVVAQNDLDGDNKNDILFQHSDGRLAVWTMHDTNFLNSRSLKNDLPVQPGWHAKAMCDLNGDGKADIVFQHNTNAMAVWLMSSLTLQTGKLINGGRPIAAGWTAQGARDMNDDNKGDILFRHTDGRFAIWYMNGTNIVSAGTMQAGPAPSTGWKVAGMSDFNGDGNHDILWQNATGNMAYWWLNNNMFVGVNGFYVYVLRNQSFAVGPR